VIAPTVHHGGTSGDALRDGLLDVARRLNAALAALVEAGPNGRDYAPGDLSAALATHAAHCLTLRSMRDDYVRAAEEVQDQIDARVMR
jgi:hypothetical protein